LNNKKVALNNSAFKSLQEHQSCTALIKNTIKDKHNNCVFDTVMLSFTLV